MLNRKREMSTSKNAIMVPTFIAVIFFIVVVPTTCDATGTEGRGSEHAYQGNAIQSPPLQAERKQRVVEHVIAKLTRAGWDSQAARKVVTLNADWFEDLFAENRSEMERQTDILATLGKMSNLTVILRKRPEVAGLLAGSPSPNLIAESLRSDEHYREISSLFVTHANPQDAVALADGLRKNRDLVAKLYDRGLVGVETLFIFPRNKPGSAEYDSWLNEGTAGQFGA